VVLMMGKCGSLTDPEERTPRAGAADREFFDNEETRSYE
jgi:hypothetical protein